MELQIHRCIHCERVTVLELENPMYNCPCGAEFYPMSRRLVCGEPVKLSKIAGEPLEHLVVGTDANQGSSQLLFFEEKKTQLKSLQNTEVAMFLAKVTEDIQGSTRLHITISTVNVPRHAVDAVIGELTKKGWSAKFVADQRDGDYLDISEGDTRAITGRIGDEKLRVKDTT